MMNRFFLPFALAAFTLPAGLAAAQVPPDIAAALKAIGPVVEVPKTTALYTPLFAAQKPPYAGVKVTRDVAYGADPLQKLDVFSTAAAGAKQPVVVHIHGGGFERGDKILSPGSPFYDNVMLWLTQNGMVGVNLNYRLAPKNTYPAAEQDLAAALVWVKNNIAAQGGDPDKIILWGQSAGASLIANYLAHREFHPGGRHGVAAAVLQSGVYEAGPSNYFGNDPEQLKARSSIEGIMDITIPILLTYTGVDAPFAKPQAEKLSRALCEGGFCPSVVEIKDHSHISQTLSVGSADTSVSERVLRFVRGLR